MPAKIKKAYRKIVKSYNTDNSLGKKYISGYYLTDIDNDSVAELIVRARKIAMGSEPLVDTLEESPVTIAAEEIAAGKVEIC